MIATTTSRVAMTSPIARCANEAARGEERRPDPAVADGDQDELVGRERERHRREDHLDLRDVAARQVLDQVAHGRNPARSGHGA
ncbi:MAG TPA: hypothetical protein VHK00_09845, partial [Miltoncostaeaceae bacterium]|nr:hypothetical protein [Miltoncostaeaceae bacterium]